MNDSNRSSPNGVNPQTTRAPRFVIVGGGFGGLAAAKALRTAQTVNILIDRKKYFPRASGLTVRSDRSLSPARTDKESND